MIIKIDPVLAKPPVPQSVTMRQARLALLQIGKLDAVSAALAAIPDPARRTAAQIEWEYAQTVQRDSMLAGQIAAAVGLTSGKLDELFKLAARL